MTKSTSEKDKEASGGTEFIPAEQTKEK